jgi:outer membrane receptor protein involved in Fe transport
MQSMQSSKSKAIVGALLSIALLPHQPLCAQSQIPTPAQPQTTRSTSSQPTTPAQAQISIAVEDSSGAVLTGATISDASNNPLGRTNSSGAFTVSCATPCTITVSAAGFAPQTLTLVAPTTPAPTTIRLEPAANSGQITVTAYRAPLGDLESPATTRVLSQRTLAATAAITLDDQLRQLPGVELFRRSPSLVANPTSQGISLRALGSTSASRTLVTEDDVPLNDPLGGWIHWQEQPELSIRDIELVRGGAGDLYGSSAISGVINVVPVLPTAGSNTAVSANTANPASSAASTRAELTSSYGAEGTYDSSALAQSAFGPWGLLAAAGLLGTDGYIQESPFQRGPVDVASNVHSQNALLLATRQFGPLRLFARSSGFNESRHNGTPYQFNATRLIRYATGADFAAPRSAALALRLYGSDERYRQTFSSISSLPDFGIPTCTYRCGEIPTRYSYVPTNELGASLHFSQPLRAGLVLVAGADSHDVRVWDLEQTFGATAALTNLHDHQRDSGAYAEAMAVHRAWTFIASARLDWYQNYDGRQLTYTAAPNGFIWTPSRTQPTQQSQLLFDPRLGLSRKLDDHWALSASGFRAFRAPSLNELYRSTQVGDELTLPNDNLLSERATGWETGLASQRSWGTVRASYFLTQVNRPITAFTINPTSSPILLMRENLGQIESRGVSLDYELAPLRWLVIDGGYQYAHAVVSRGALDYGKWIPEVARNLATLNLRATKPRLGTLTLQSRLSGRMFDDDANTYLLAGYFRLDAYASHTFGSGPITSRIDLFAAGENLTGQSIEVSKTPTTTLGQPRVARVGFTFRPGSEVR